MNDFEKALEELHEALFDTPEVQQFFALRQVIESDQELMAANAAMRAHQKAMAKHQNNDEIYFREKALYEKYSVIYNKHPLVVNYEALRGTVNDLLKQIKTIVE